MTDDEIVKALECCSHTDDTLCCSDCPLIDSEETDCLLRKSKNALDLINRQAAEIERLQEENQTITDNFNCQQTVYLDLSEIIKKQANELKTAKSEAIKEFAERLKEDLFYKCGDINYTEVCDTRKLIDNLVKEMTEESYVIKSVEPLQVHHGTPSFSTKEAAWEYLEQCRKEIEDDR